MNKDEMKNKISMALKDTILQQGFELICKENEKLKNRNSKLAGQKASLERWYGEAKELLKEFNRVLKEHGFYHNALYKRAEQFLNSEVEK